MAKKDALRDLQSRLAGRLKAAQTEGVSASWLAVEAGGVKYLLPLEQSGEIFPLSASMPVPYTQAWFLGVANLRGGLYGVVDLASFVSQSQPKSQSELMRSESRLIALNAVLQINCALLIDRLGGLRGLNAFKESKPAPAGSPDYFGHGYIDEGGTYWQEINLQTLSLQPQFLSIST
ncbi:MAG: chemotaxis protein CheW [Burkholderiaceae bacterium]